MDRDFQLIPHEDIFDLTTSQLQQELEILQIRLNNSVEDDEKNKIKETIDLIQQEIDQRTVLSEFEALCSKHSLKEETPVLAPCRQDFIKKFENFNAQFQQLVDGADKQNGGLKLTLPPIDQHQQHREEAKSATRQSRIKVAKLGSQTPKHQVQKQEGRSTVKPKLIAKIPRNSDTLTRVLPPKNQTQQVKPADSSSNTGQKRQSMVEERKPNLKGAPKKAPTKKVTKKDANDWLVQMVRDQEEKKQRSKHNPRSSTLIEGDPQVQQPLNLHPQRGPQDTEQTIPASQRVVASQAATLKLDSQQGYIVIRLKQPPKTKLEEEQQANRISPEVVLQKPTLGQLQIVKQTNESTRTQDTLIGPAQIKLPMEVPQSKIVQQQKYQQNPNQTQLLDKGNDQPTIDVVALSLEVQSTSKCSTQDPQLVSLQTGFYQTRSTFVTQNTIVVEQLKYNMTLRVEEQLETDEVYIQQQLHLAHRVDKTPSKACYSQQYWERVRKQALTNLERVRLMKQLRQNQKDQLSNEIKMANAYNQITQQSQLDPKESRQSDLNTSASQKQGTQSVASPQKQVVSKQQIKTIPRKLAPKKKVVGRKPQVALFRLPQLIPNYLDVLPTFNHIFHVMYSKPPSEALLDIPLLMKQTISIFTNHLASLSDNVSYKQPLFRAFDNTCMYVNDAHQLLLHAQTTNIDLKTLLARLNVFNENLHGRFQGDNQQALYYRVVKSRQEVYDIITTAFLRAQGWQELPHGMNLKTSWNLMWSWAKPQVDFSKLLVFQKINHFPFNKNMSRKDLLYRNLDNFKRICKTSISFVPITFNLPKEYSQFSVKFNQDKALEGDMNIWIMKPIGKSRGRGIRLINNTSDLNYLDNIVVQKYLKNPLLLDGFKFDLRVYVLVTSIHPLEVFIYKEGFARMSTQKYTLDPHSIKNTFIHLTNFSIQRNNKEAQNATDDGGSKITFKSLRQKLQEKGVKWQTIWDKIHDIIIKSLLACSLAMPSSPSAFQLFGYDVIIDTESNVHLIEINASPSLERTYLIDQIVKQSLIDDIMDLMDLPNFDRQECINVMSQRLQRKTPTNSIQDNIDIGRILRFKPLRKIGQMPSKVGLFERVAPSERSLPYQRIVSAKHNPNIRHIDSWN